MPWVCARISIQWYLVMQPVVLIGTSLKHRIMRQDAAAGSPQASPLAALLGVVRNVFPDNLARAAVDMNILGIITFSLAFGLALAGLGRDADGFVHGVEVQIFSSSHHCE